MALSQERGNLDNTEEQLHEINSELPCLDSSRECVEQLTQQASAAYYLQPAAGNIADSLSLKTGGYFPVSEVSG